MAGEMYAVSGETLTRIANAIRGKTGDDDYMEVSSFASAIAAIPSGGLPTEISEIKCGTVTAQSTVTGRLIETVSHGLSRLPDLILYTMISGNVSEWTGTLNTFSGFFLQYANYAGLFRYNSTTQQYRFGEQTLGNSPIRNVTSTTFDFHTGASSTIQAGTKFVWIAINFTGGYDIN